MSTHFSQILPLERAVIGLCLSDPVAAEELFERVSPEWFFLPEHARYFEAMHERKNQGWLDYPFLKTRFANGRWVAFDRRRRAGVGGKALLDHRGAELHTGYRRGPPARSSSQRRLKSRTIPGTRK
jgi:hypothetical protein